MALGLGLPRPNFQQGYWGMVGRMDMLPVHCWKLEGVLLLLCIIYIYIYAFAKGGNLHLMHPTSSNTEEDLKSLGL